MQAQALGFVAVNVLRTTEEPSVLGDMETVLYTLFFVLAGLHFDLGVLGTAGALALIIVLVPAIRELKALFIDLQKTSAEVRELTVEMKKISANVEGKLDGIDTVLANSQKIVSNVGRAYSLMNNSVLKNAEWLAMIPAILLGWKAVSKMKRRNNERQQ